MLDLGKGKLIQTQLVGGKSSSDGATATVRQMLVRCAGWCCMAALVARHMTAVC